MIRQSIKENTKDIHRYVENLPIMKEIVGRTVGPEAYTNYLVQIRAIYSAIENNPAYTRLGWGLSLEGNYGRDIDEMKKMFKIDHVSISEITSIYCRYLSELIDSETIAAHAYVRYMADLMGGSVIKRRLNSEWSSTAYDLDRGGKDIIIEYLNNEIQDSDSFLREVYNSFMSHAAILHEC